MRHSVATPLLFLAVSLVQLMDGSAFVQPALLPRAQIRRAAAAAVSMDASEGRINEMIGANKVFLFMKGNKIFPQCGFSQTATQILNALDVEFETFDVLADEEIRQGIKTFSNWPTIPQLYVDGEFVGGCDIMIEEYQSGNLKKMLKA